MVIVVLVVLVVGGGGSAAAVLPAGSSLGGRSVHSPSSTTLSRRHLLQSYFIDHVGFRACPLVGLAHKTKLLSQLGQQVEAAPLPAIRHSTTR